MPKGSTKEFDAIFKINPREAVSIKTLGRFFETPSEYPKISTSLVRKMSPNSLSIMEFREKRDINIASKMVAFPALGDKVNQRWKFLLVQEFNISSDSDIFSESPTENGIPLLTGRMFHQFSMSLEVPKYWIDESDGRGKILGKSKKSDGLLDYQGYRWVHRRIARNTDSRTLISTIIPPGFFTEVNSTSLRVKESEISNSEMLFLCGVCNSFCLDWFIRQKVSSTLNMFYLYQLPVPRSKAGDRYFSDIVDRAAKLICTTPEFDDLAAEIGLGSHHNGATDETQRAQLRAQLDGIIAHLYGLTEPEFTHILSTFPVVPQATKDAALQAYKDLAPLPGDLEIAQLIQQGESNNLEFKSTARWNLRENKKDRTMEEIILKTVAAFLNSQGGTLLIGVADDGSVVGLDPDYQTLKKQDRDGFELWLMNDLLLKEFGKPAAALFPITFHSIDGKDVCKIEVARAPELAYVNIKDKKTGQLQETLFIRTGNATNKLDKPSEIQKYIQQRWS